MATLTDRIDRMEAELRSLERELAELKRLTRTEVREQAVTLPPLSPVEPERRVKPQPVAALDWSEMLGARALAWVGGGVTVLGIVFFFVLAVERGWIGHDTRLALGALASAAVFGAGMWSHRRFGDTYAAVSAAGAGLTGWFATLLASSALYHLLPDAGSLAVAGLVAAIGLVLAVHWRSETVAGIGLVGAMLVSMPIAWNDGVTALGVTFVGVALLAAVAAAVECRWTWLALVSVAVAGAQAVALVAQHDASGVQLALAFAAIALAGTIGLTFRGELDYPAASLAMLSAVLAGGALAIAYSGDREGWALLALAATYVGAAGAVARWRRDLAAVLVAIALAFGAIASADLVSLFSLTAVWSVEAALLAWLSRRVDARFAWTSGAFLVLAIGHALATEAKPHDLFVANSDPAHGVPALLLCIAATAFAAWLVEDLRDEAAWVAAALGLYGLSLLLLALFEQFGAASVHTQFQRGHTAVSAVWAVVGAATLYLGLRLARRPLQIAGFALFGLAVAKLFVYDLAFLSSVARAFSFLAVGAMLLAAGFTYQRFAGTRST